jgi:hypothetical protein
MYSTINGNVHFTSDAPLELIEVSSNQMQGILDIKKKVFAFKMFIKSFEGFNNPLQQIHFHENYMEANDYPIAVFKGKLIEPIKNGKAIYRAKGSLDIHGVSVERIIIVELEISDSSVNYSSTFTIPLKDHNIELPRIVYQKIAEEILVKVNGSMTLKS